MKIKKTGLEVIMKNDEIKIRVKLLARRIYDRYYHIPTPLLCFVVLDGAFIFASDLIKELTELGLELEIKFIKTWGYKGSTLLDHITLDMLGNDYDDLINDRYVLVIEDILDTGETYKVITKRLKDFNPISIEYCAFLCKGDEQFKDIDRQNFLYGHAIANEFVVGYGLDYNGRYRQLKDIYVWNKQKSLDP